MEIQYIYPFMNAPCPTPIPDIYTTKPDYAKNTPHPKTRGTGDLSPPSYSPLKIGINHIGAVADKNTATQR